MNQHKEFFNNHAENWDEMQCHADIKKIREILDEQGIKKNEKILDVGSGTGILLPILEELAGDKAEIVALDFSEKMIEKAHEKFGSRFRYILADVEDTELESSYFNRVICYSCFPHFNDKEKALNEIFRVTKPGGSLLIAHTKSRDEINNFHKNVGGPVKHHKIPSGDIMKELLINAGFSEIRIKESQDSYQVTAIKGDL